MMMTVSYDVHSDRARRRIFKLLRLYGEHVQKSVFECDLTERTLCDLRLRCAEEIDPATDSVRFYPLCASCRAKIEVMGTGPVPEEDEGFYIA